MAAERTKSCGCRHGRDLFSPDVQVAGVNLQALPEICEGLEVEWPHQLPEHMLRLMDTLGVKVRERV